MPNYFIQVTGDDVAEVLEDRSTEVRFRGPQLSREQTMNSWCLNERLSGKRRICSSFEFPGPRGTK